MLTQERIYKYNREKIWEYTKYIRRRLNLVSPVDMFKLLAVLGLNIQIDSNMLEPVKIKNNIIFIQDTYTREYLQFELAKYLGYIIFSLSNRKYSQYKLYYIINEFAISLLVPNDELIELVNQNIEIPQIAKYFQVQPRVIKCRCKVLFNI